MVNFNRRNTLWLGILASIIAVVLLIGNVPATVQLLLLGIFAFAVVATFFNPKLPVNLMQTVQERTQNRVARSRMSPQAQEASARAEARGTYISTNVNLIDVGMITTQSGDDGMVMRRTRTISKDDDGVRPFVTLQVPHSESERNANFRFEIIDQNGVQQHVHEMNIYLRTGEVNVLSDHHLPLFENPQVEGMGDWDLRVYIDDALVGIHNFTLTPSYEDRRERLNRNRSKSNESDGEYYVTSPQSQGREDGSPLSLEELLRKGGGSS